MTAFAVVFTLYICPGSVRLLGIQFPLAKLPDSVKPALAAIGVCESQPTVEFFEAGNAAGARARVSALGKPAQLYAVQAGIAGPPLADWKTTASFKETP